MYAISIYVQLPYQFVASWSYGILGVIKLLNCSRDLHENTFYKKPCYLECPFLLHVTLTISSTCKGTVLYVKTMTDTTPSHTLAL